MDANVVDLAFLRFKSEAIDVARLFDYAVERDRRGTDRRTRSIVVRLGLDHVEFLGDTLAQIAREKAGIIKPGVPAVREDETKHGAAEELKSLLPDLLVMVFEIALIVFYALPVWSRIKMNQPETEPKPLVDELLRQNAELMAKEGWLKAKVAVPA